MEQPNQEETNNKPKCKICQREESEEVEFLEVKFKGISHFVCLPCTTKMSSTLVNFAKKSKTLQI